MRETRTDRKWALTLWTQQDEQEVRRSLAALAADALDVEVAKTHAVARSRALGLSWETIAGELHVSRQSAWERWHHLDAAGQG